MEDRFWAVWAEGLGMQAACQAAGVSEHTGLKWVRQRGGVKPQQQSTGTDLILEDRIEIQAGIAAGQTNAQIARTLGVHRGTVGRELLRNRRPSDVGPANQRRGYNALKAQERADSVKSSEVVYELVGFVILRWVDVTR